MPLAEPAETLAYADTPLRLRGALAIRRLLARYGTQSAVARLLGAKQGEVSLAVNERPKASRRLLADAVALDGIVAAETGDGAESDNRIAQAFIENRPKILLRARAASAVNKALDCTSDPSCLTMLANFIGIDQETLTRVRLNDPTLPSHKHAVFVLQRLFPNRPERWSA